MFTNLPRDMLACVDEPNGADVDSDKFSDGKVDEVKGKVRQLGIEICVRICPVEETLEYTSKLTENDLRLVSKGDIEIISVY